MGRASPEAIARPVRPATLAERLRAKIRSAGPIGLDRFMSEANAHYYATRDPLGAGGDFTTAPEIHQMFGEIIGAALADCWRRAGKPAGTRLVELGPGRGTLARDALRAMAAAGLHPPLDLVETSPALRRAQRRLLPQARWHDDLTGIGPGPCLVVANEFLDALPIRQWVGGEERRVALDGERFVMTGGSGPVRETSPEREAAAAAVAALLLRSGGAALIIDYGHEKSAPGDTLQAVRGHRFADPLADPGEADLTAHVDFEAVGRAARSAGARVAGPVGQGDWLGRLGIAERARRLAAANPGQRPAIEAALERLTGPQAMGRLFKLMALTAPGWPVPAGFG